jgi:hypothetical protein
MPECDNCGSFVTPKFARVFGDNHDNVDGCVSCLTAAELTAREASVTGGRFRVPDSRRGGSP